MFENANQDSLHNHGFRYTVSRLQSIGWILLEAKRSTLLGNAPAEGLLGHALESLEVQR